MNQSNSPYIGTSGTLKFPLPPQLHESESAVQDDLPDFKDFEEMDKFLSYDSGSEECITSTSEVEVYTEPFLDNTVKEEQSFKCDACSRYFSTKSGLKKHCVAIHSNFATWECNKCHQYFWNIRMMKNHEDCCQDSRDFKCKYCDVNFTLEEDLTIHLRLHASENFYLCTKCNQNFENNRTYRYHIKSCSGVITKEQNKKTVKESTKLAGCTDDEENITETKVQSEFEMECENGCKACDKLFTTVKDLEDHIKIKHSLNKYYNCPVCHRSFQKYKKLKKHIRIQHNAMKKHLKCEFCNKTFYRENHLATHKRMHLTIQMCRVCFLSFDTAKDLEEHEKEHFGINYCIICDKKFSYRGHFLIHINKHYNKKHTCPTCCKVFSSYDAFKIHLLQHSKVGNSERRKWFRCKHCNLVFSHMSAIDRHVANYHSDHLDYRCDICQCLFINKTLLLEHKEFHSKKEYKFACDICNHKFTQQPSLNRHMRRHTGERPYKCSFCRVRFSRKDTLKEHIRMHTKEKPYECPFCKKTFGQRTALNSHKTNTHYMVKE